MNELAKALAAFQAEAPNLHKGETAKVKGKTKDGKPYEYEYRYLSMDAAMEKIRPILAKNGLALAQFPSVYDGKPALRTILLHSSGEHLDGTMLLPVSPADTAQALGSAITYARRYSLMAVLGLVADEDDDGKTASHVEVENRRGQPAPDPLPSEGTAVSGGPDAPARPEDKALVNDVLARLHEMNPQINWVDLARTVTQTKFNKQDGSLLTSAEMVRLASMLEEQLSQKDPGDAAPSTNEKQVA